MVSLSSPTMFSLIHFIMGFLTFSTVHSVLECYTSIFSFGDSLADTGNSIRESNWASDAGKFPYGETYFHRPTGRFSDGRLIIDFIAEELGLPYVPPYLGGSSDGDFRQGVNFAFAGATALDAAFFQERRIPNEYTNNSLGIQLGWFEDLLPSLCSNPPGCGDIFKKSLFLVGEIGGNDYNYPFLQRRSLEEIQTFVPLVINAIGSAIDMLIKYGARTLVVPSNLPIGCSAEYLTVLESQKKEDYDPLTGCLTYLNKFSEYHNRLLLQEMDRLRAQHPHATIIYADYYNAAMRFYRSPDHFATFPRLSPRAFHLPMLLCLC
ncbi:GDSL esterase/lipase At1g28590-like isoform X2 [Magnolia sinica]|uniref:GDSL esterase/lipase At1g28590-like isoform X2 n=1 Tax=Magnolia sinica TaxID=86752 RepID=UPI00265B5D47|nr:GDSL esterase/lipase At1g28590-like isoform X2 [Magnolia sinica]